MAHLNERLKKFEQERKEIHDKMKPYKDILKPLSRRLVQVGKNIECIKAKLRSQDKV